ncbi:Reticulon-like protein B8 [Glycine max]|nr:Reticulon-like protein B8 [Glycine max]
MSEKTTADNLIENLVDTFVDKKKSVSFFEDDKSDSVSSQINRLFGRQKPVHHVLGAADVLLWRNKKISASVLTSATIVWVLFEWLNYNFLTILCFALVLVMLAQFLWSNASGMFNSSPSNVPRLVLPEELFVVGCLFAGAVIGTWFNFISVIYIGFVAAHTLPVLYEMYEDEVDNFVYKVLGQMQNQYRNLDTSVLSKIPKGKGKKHE